MPDELGYPNEPGRRRVMVVGNGKMAADAVEVLCGQDRLAGVAWTFHRNDVWSARAAKKIRAKWPTVGLYECDRIKDSDGRASIAMARPDLILSVNNFDIFPADLLRIPSDGIINFHNGPLPEYRGVNIPSWALINMEQTHGVTWHFISEAIDGGDIVAQEHFDVTPDETAISLTFKCIRCGLALLPAVIADYLAGTLQRTAQDSTAGSYYSRRDIPNGGFADLNWPEPQLSAFMRALSFRPYPNDFIRPRVVLSNGVSICADSGEYVPGRAAARPGDVIAASQNELHVAARDGRLILRDLFDLSGRPLKAVEICASIADNRAGDPAYPVEDAASRNQP